MNHVDHPEVTHLELCAGYGGLHLGLARAIPGLRVIAASEIEAFACANLVAKMEGGSMDAFPIWTNLHTFPWELYRGKVDVLSGGFPCQPFSLAGVRAGTEDERHLYPVIARGIDIVQPRLVFLENVEGLISTRTIEHRQELEDYLAQLQAKADRSNARTRWRLESSIERTRRYFLHKFGMSVLQYVCCDLESRGYTVEAGLFSAREAGAPHGRKRVFIMAHRLGAGLERYLRDVGAWGEPGRDGAQAAGPTGAGGVSRAAHWTSQPNAWPAGPGEFQHDWEPPRTVRVANAERAERRTGDSAGGDSGEGEDLGRSETSGWVGECREPVADASGERRQQKSRGSSGDEKANGGEGRHFLESDGNHELDGDGEGDHAAGTLADCDGQREQQPEGPEQNIGGRPEYGGEGIMAHAERPVLPGRITTSGEAEGRRTHDQSGGSGACGEQSSFATLGRDFDGRADWLDNAKLLHTACDSRIDELRLLGNGVVPATAAIAFMTLARKLCSNT